MFRAAYHSSSGALTVFAASGLHKHVVTGRSQVWVGKKSPTLQVQNEGADYQHSDGSHGSEVPSEDNNALSSALPVTLWVMSYDAP